MSNEGFVLADKNDTFGTTEAAEYLGISKSTLKKWRTDKSGKEPPVKSFRNELGVWVYWRSELDGYLAENPKRKEKVETRGRKAGCKGTKRAKILEYPLDTPASTVQKELAAKGIEVSEGYIHNARSQSQRLGLLQDDRITMGQLEACLVLLEKFNQDIIKACKALKYASKIDTSGDS